MVHYSQMGIQQTEKPKIHWNYFLALEADCQKLARYIEFAENNYPIYSIELAHLLFAAASEADVAAKLICKQIGQSIDPRNVDDWRNILKPAFPKIERMCVTIPRHGIRFRPWENWGLNQNPIWWRAYNNVKHERNAYFQEASLKNALNALGGLYILLLYLYKDLAIAGELSPSPSFLLLEATHLGGTNFLDIDHNIQYDL